MQCSWLKKTKADSLIIFYSGWGMQENSVLLDYGVYDFLVFYDYRSINIPLKVIEEINTYKHVYIVAWSLGIVPAVLNHKLIKAKKLIAINGSIFPSDDRYGIPEAIYQGTYNNLDMKNLERFYRRMFAGKEDYEKFSKTQKDIDINQLKEELISIRELSKEVTFKDKNIFKRVIVSVNDKIFPVNNLLDLWREPVVIDKSHYPFFEFTDWQEILNA